MKISCFTLLAILFTHLSSNALIKIPKGSSPQLDGVFAPGEWSDALEQDLADGGKVYFKHNKQSIYIGVRGNTGKQGWAHVYVITGDTLLILHASAALGTAVYYKDVINTWQPKQAFSWAVRDTTFSEKAIAERQAFYEKTHWIANTCNMGEKQLLEFKINRKLLPKKEARLAVVFASNAKEPHYFPATLQDDCLAEQLIYGNTPKDLKFDQTQWCKVELSNKK